METLGFKGRAFAIGLGVSLSCQCFGTYVAPVGSDGKGTGLQTKLNGLLQTPMVPGDTWNRGTLSNGDYINGTVQLGQSASDIVWGLVGGSASMTTIVLEIAGNASVNTFGFYDPANPTKRAQLINGAATTGSKLYVRFNGTQLQSSGNGITFNNVANGNFSSTSFGVYLGTPSRVLYSDPSLNGGNDNLVAYQGYGSGNASRKIQAGSSLVKWDSSTYLMAWEDLNLPTSDKDYQDMVLLMSGVAPVPEPSSYVIAGLLLLPVLGAIRKQRSEKR